MEIDASKNNQVVYARTREPAAGICACYKADLMICDSSGRI